MIWLIGIAVVAILCWLSTLPYEYEPEVGLALARLEYLAQLPEPDEPKRLVVGTRYEDGEGPE